MLTAQQKKLLVFIQSKLAETGISPSFEEMKEALELKSKSGIHRLIKALEERGFIGRLPNRARALEVLKNADGLPTKKQVETNVIGGNFAPSSAATPLNNSDENGQYISVPMHGKIAAGTPIEGVRK